MRPLKGGKGMLYEGGVRVPYIFLVEGKNSTGPNERNADSRRRSVPNIGRTGGGRSASQLSTGWNELRATAGGLAKSLDRDALFWHFPGYLGAGPGQWRTTPVCSVRAGDWKLIEFSRTADKSFTN